MVSTHPPEPTAEACDKAWRGEWNGIPTLALWYPQMGGYVGKAVAVRDDDCLDVYVWHDGEFPFTEADHQPWEGTAGPARLHHCDPGQFIGFGKVLEAWTP